MAVNNRCSDYPAWQGNAEVYAHRADYEELRHDLTKPHRGRLKSLVQSGLIGIVIAGGGDKVLSKLELRHHIATKDNYELGSLRDEEERKTKEEIRAWQAS